MADGPFLARIKRRDDFIDPGLQQSTIWLFALGMGHSGKSTRRFAPVAFANRGPVTTECPAQ